MTGGEALLAEIREQPAAWRRLADAHEPITELGARLARDRPALVRLVGHGTSDHVAVYASYALRLLCGWTALGDAMSPALYYGVPAAAPGEVAIAFSQSGETGDVVAWLRAAADAGARPVAVTNVAGSALAASAPDATVLAHAGEERSIAATKTYTGMLGAVALLGAGAAGRGAAMAAALRTAADAAETALPRLEADTARLAERFSDVQRLYVVARGVELATADEVALKLTEVAYVSAKALTATGMAHGPVAALEPGFPVWAVAGDDAALAAVAEAAARAREAGAPVIATGPAAARIAGAAVTIPTPDAGERLLAPLLSVLPGQLAARALALAKGLDPGTPRHLRKVTSAA